MQDDSTQAPPASIDGSSENGEELSKLERQILKLVLCGLTNAELAEELGVSVKALKLHMTSIFKKLAAAERIESAAKALGSKLVRFDP